MHDGWRWVWRAIGLIALVLSSISCFFLYTLWKAAVLQPVVAGKPVEHSLDVVSLQIDILSITLAAVGIALGVIGLFGYQNIKDVAIERAVKESVKAAGEKADKIATEAVAIHMGNIGATQANGPAAVEPPEVVELTEEERGD